MNELKQNKQEFKIKVGSPAMFSDVMKLYVQHKAGICQMLFGTAIPVADGDKDKIEVHEQARIVTTTEHAQRIIDVMCSSLNYYPQKPGKK